MMARLSGEALARVDPLVETAHAGSRPEAAEILIGAGIESQKELFERPAASAEEIAKRKERLRQMALDALRPKN